LHIFLDSPVRNALTKTELDIGIITQPYIDLAHSIRAGFCVSHALRGWVRITIGFTQLGPYSLTLDPTTIRYMGTDERSILHILLRAQESLRRSKIKVPYGVTIHQKPIQDRLKASLDEEVLLLLPNQRPTWQEKVSEIPKLAMYCPLHEAWARTELPSSPKAHYNGLLPRDVAILEIVHALDELSVAMEKD
jgi:hypothetical protein